MTTDIVVPVSDVRRIVRELKDYLARLKHRAHVRGDVSAWGIAREGETLAKDYLRVMRRRRGTT